LTRKEANKMLYQAVLAREIERTKSGSHSKEFHALDALVDEARNERNLVLAREIKDAI
jgi:hypothetical protein